MPRCLLTALVALLAILPGLAAAAKEKPMTTLGSPLPDPLVRLAGLPVKTAQEWWDKRRPELVRLFAEHMYGEAPPAPDNLTARVLATDAQFLGGRATLREIELRYGPAGTPPLHLLLVRPNAVRGRAPVFVGANFHGNHTCVDSPLVALPQVWVPDRGPGAKANRATAEGRGQSTSYPMAMIIDRGYAVATFYSGDLDPDKPDPSDGVQPHFPGYTWGTIAAWAWGLQRAVDYLVTDPGLDPRRIAAVGHSRLGKTAMLAAALDQRIALAIPCQAGCGGTAPSRGTVGESVERINTVFPHWFCDQFKVYNQLPSALPFDQHCLVALCAPRPVLFPNATQDTWANPLGQFEVLQAADPVYRLLGVSGLEASEPPPVGQLLNSRLGYFIREGKHSMGPEEWPAFLDFADRWMPAR